MSIIPVGMLNIMGVGLPPKVTRRGYPQKSLRSYVASAET